MVRTFELGVPNLLLLVDPVTGELDDPEVAAAVAAMSEDLASYTGITPARVVLESRRAGNVCQR